MVVFEHISKSYGKGKKAVDDLSMTIPDGSVYGFLGPNGAGKSTTIKMLVGLLKADEGTITINGKRMSEDPVGVKRMIGYVSDEPLFYEKLTAEEQVDFIADIYDVEEREAKKDRLFSLFDLKERGDEISSFSHGMKQKLSVICALLHDPKLLVLDEPMVGLDPKSAFTMKQMMQSYAKEGNTVFFSTHVLEVAEEVCSEVGIIDEGKLIADGTFQSLKEHQGESLEELFLKLTEKQDA